MYSNVTFCFSFWGTSPHAGALSVEPTGELPSPESPIWSLWNIFGSAPWTRLDVRPNPSRRQCPHQTFYGRTATANIECEILKRRKLCMLWARERTLSRSSYRGIRCAGLTICALRGSFTRASRSHCCRPTTATTRCLLIYYTRLQQHARKLY